MSNFESTWTDARCETLRTLWTDGLSCSQIAAELGGMTRNAVIGKVHRMGLPRRNAQPRKPRRPSGGLSVRTSEGAIARELRRRLVSRGNGGFDFLADREPQSEATVINDDHAIPQEQRKSLFDLTDETCRWPVGDVGTPEFFFCGATTQSDRPYCSAHCQRASSDRPPRLPRVFRNWSNAA
jgi:GcrA cell cycle regulator